MNKELEVDPKKEMMEAIQDALDQALAFGDDVTAFELATILRASACDDQAAVQSISRGSERSAFVW